MAIYHCTTKPISRASGRSATASCAYRSGEKIVDRQTGEIHDYTKKQGVIHTNVITPKSINIENIDREDLWNMAEQSEKRKDARVAREFVIALPHEIPATSQKKIAEEFASYLCDRYGVVADLAIHEPSKGGDDKNVHAHIMVTTRKVEIDQENGVILTEKSTLELSNSKRKTLGLKGTQEDIKEIREQWATIANRELKREGIKERIDHRNYADQEKDQIPTKHEGVVVTELRRKGQIVGVAKLNEEIKEENQIIKSIKIEDQENRKPSFLERVGIRKVEKIESDLPPIREVVKNIDTALLEADKIRVHAMYDKLKIENEIRDLRLAREREENQKRRAEKIAKQPESQLRLEREYKQIVYGDKDHQISDFKELLAMNKFLIGAEKSGNGAELLEALKKKHASPEAVKQPTTKNTPVLEPKALIGNDSPQKNNIEPVSAQNAPDLSPKEPTENGNENLSKKEEFQNVLSEVRERFKAEKNTPKQSVKMDYDDWDMDR